MRIFAAPLAIALLAATAPAAGAATVSAQFEFLFLRGGDQVEDVTVVVGDSAVRMRDDAGPLDIDPSAASRCTRVDEHEATCTPEPSIRVELGGGDDRFRSSGPGADRMQTHLGPGNDTGSAPDRGFLNGDDGDDELSGAILLGLAGDDRLVIGEEIGHRADGGEGDDVIVGTDAADSIEAGPGRDKVTAGGGDDRIVEDEAQGEPDEFDGGAGFDRIDYSSDAGTWRRTGPVEVDLAGGTGGGEGDRVIGFEAVTATRFGDVLRGTEGDDVLDGGLGDDVLDGRGGNDRLTDVNGSDRMFGGAGDDVLSGGLGDDALDGGPGNDLLDGAFGADVLVGGDGDDRLSGGERSDRFDGGTGDDVIHAEADFFRDAVRCGGGADVLVADDRDDVQDACASTSLVSERVRRFLKAEGARAIGRVAGRRARLTVGCSFRDVGAIRGTIVLFLGGREIGRGTFDCDTGQAAPSELRPSVRADIPISRAAARRVRKRGAAPIVAIIDLGMGPGQLPIRERVRLVKAGTA